MSTSPVADDKQRAAGTARRRREQRLRSTAKHVAWITSLCQARASHHTSPGRESGGERKGLDVVKLLQRIEALEKLVETLIKGEKARPQNVRAQEGPCCSSCTWEVISHGGIRVREEPSLQSAVLGVKAYGNHVRGVLQGEWVRLEDEPGFVVTSIQGVDVLIPALSCPQLPVAGPVVERHDQQVSAEVRDGVDTLVSLVLAGTLSMRSLDTMEAADGGEHRVVYDLVRSELKNRTEAG